MKKIIVFLSAVIVVIFFMIISAEDKNTQIVLTGENIFNYFPICEIRSSFQPSTCRILEPKIRDDYRLNQLKINKKSIENNQLILENTEWIYVFTINKLSNMQYKIEFADDAKIGTYHTIVSYNVLWDQEQKNWIIDGRELIYADANPNDQTDPGKYIPYPKPVPFKK